MNTQLGLSLSQSLASSERQQPAWGVWQAINSDMMYNKQDDNNWTPIVVGWLPYGPTYRIIDPAKPLFFYIFQNVMQESFSW